MSADYWGSSQRDKWQLTRQALLDARRRVCLLERKMIHGGLIKDYPHVTHDFNMRMYLHNLLIKLGRRLNVRQVALASAEVYLTRFLTRVLLKEVNVYLLVATCLYVACKIEECPQHIRLVVLEARNLWPEYIPHDVTRLAEFEFYLIEEMDLYLCLHPPYHSLLQLRDYLDASRARYGFALAEDELQHAWLLINDSYVTDVHMVMPPHVIAVAAIYITIVLKKHLSAIRGGKPAACSATPLDMHIQDLMALRPVGESVPGVGHKSDHDTIKIDQFMDFLHHSHINLDEVVEAMQEMVGLYVAWNRYNEGTVRKALQHMLLNR